MERQTFFVADLHLIDQQSPTTRFFLHLLSTLQQQHAEQAPTQYPVDALYILGDLFEYWLGDDDDNALNREIVAALSACTFPIYFCHGNRDFLLGQRFAQMAHIELLETETVIDLYGKPTLLMHGDTLCSHDLAYQAFRSKVQQPSWQNHILRKPLWQRRWMARYFRLRSRLANRKKQQQKQKYGSPQTNSIMDVCAETVRQVMQTHGVNQLIHGHTHRPQIEHLAYGNRVVLGDWHAGQPSLMAIASNLDSAPKLLDVREWLILDQHTAP